MQRAEISKATQIGVLYFWQSTAFFLHPAFVPSGRPFTQFSDLIPKDKEFLGAVFLREDTVKWTGFLPVFLIRNRPYLNTGSLISEMLNGIQEASIISFNFWSFSVQKKLAVV